MHSGMMWFDSSPDAPLTASVQKAIDYYRRKYHRDTNLCLVPPALLGHDQPQVGKVTLRGYNSVLPGHIWVGIEDRRELAASTIRSRRPAPRRGSCCG